MSFEWLKYASRNLYEQFFILYDFLPPDIPETWLVFQMHLAFSSTQQPIVYSCWALLFPSFATKTSDFSGSVHLDGTNSLEVHIQIV